MDLTPFFLDVARIATALETIARNSAPTIEADSRPLLSAEPKIDTAGTEGRTRPRSWAEVEAEAKVQGEVLKAGPEAFEGMAEALTAAAPKPTPAVQRVLDAIRDIHAAGTTTANGIAKKLRERNIPHPSGNNWHNISAKAFMDQLGLESTYSFQGGRRPKRAEPAPEPAEAAPEPDPEPAQAGPEAVPEPPEPAVDRRVNRAFVEREFKPRRTDDGHMSLRGLLSEKTRANLEAHEKAKAADRALIDEAIAAGKVTKLPACTDSDGVNHLEESGHGMIRPGGPSFGPNSGNRVMARGSMNG